MIYLRGLCWLPYIILKQTKQNKTNISVHPRFAPYFAWFGRADFSSESPNLHATQRRNSTPNAAAPNPIVEAFGSPVLGNPALSIAAKMA